MVIDIFIRTYKKDFPLLKYSIYSILKFVKSYRNIIVTVRNKEYNELLSFLKNELCYQENMNIIKIYSVYNFDDTIDYLGQQITKLNAHFFTSADYILYIDSDCVFYDYYDINNLFTNGKIDLFVEKWEDLSNNYEVWKIFLELIGLNTPYEFMRRFPLIYPSSILKNIRDFITNKYDRPFEDACLHLYNLAKKKSPNRHPLFFSEFNLIGAYSFLYKPEYYNFVSPQEKSMKDIAIKQLQHADYNNIDDQIKEMKILLHL
jgi:hypothetical protein